MYKKYTLVTQNCYIRYNNEDIEPRCLQNAFAILISSTKTTSFFLINMYIFSINIILYYKVKTFMYTLTLAN